jgi:DNA polymerase-3 subunit gamma/tau
VTNGTHYTVLARRFRPQAFDDVVGQEHVSLALRNAIRAGRVAHAYLFTGARGVGKTSTARILAKALNCPNVKDGIPCNHCEICEGVSAGNDVDVLEIDGASNRGIDDIRSLRANVGVRSMRTQYKVYIIDEVHMLTKEAFNALLKTLEEPPPNVKFVFCTTEPNKVPDTILSRCQRFDFSAIGEVSIAKRLSEIASAEGYQVSDDALELVARRARGSMRDSQSLFDQLLAFSDGTVTGDDVHRMLGTAGDDRLLELFTAVVEHRPGEVLRVLDESLEAGVQAGELVDQAVAYLRDLMVVHSGTTTVALSSVSAACRDQLIVHSQRLGIHSIMAGFQIMADAKNQMFRASFSRTILEMALVQLSLLENLSVLSDLLSGRLPELPSLPSPTGNAPGPAGPDRSTRPEPNAGVSADSAMEKKKPESLSSLAGISSLTKITDASDIEADEHEGESRAEPEVQEPDAPESSPEAAVDPDLLLKQLISAMNPALSAALRQAAGAALQADNRFEILLEGSHDFARRTLESSANREEIEQQLLQLTGRKMEFVVTGKNIQDRPVASTEPGKGTESRREPVAVPVVVSKPGKPMAENRVSPEQSGGADAANVNLLHEVDPQRDPFVRHVIEVFGAAVVRVMPTPVSATPASGDES